jgi:membrane-bound serine protease (ClpP class)
LQEGKVFVHGELWNAISKDPIEKGAKVRVVKVENLVLEVEPIE